MKVKELIQRLEKLPPDADVTYVNLDQSLRGYGVRETLSDVEIVGDCVELSFQ